MLIVAALRLLIAAQRPVLAWTAGTNRGKPRVLGAPGLPDGGGRSLGYPSSTHRASVTRRDEVLTRRGSAADLVREHASDAGVLIGYARCSTDKQDLAAQRHTLLVLGVSEDRVYLDHGMTGRNRKRPGLEQALAAVHHGDTLVVPKLARSVPA